MRKIVLMASLLFAGANLNAQGLYGELSVGYGVGAPSTLLGSDVTATATTYSQKGIYGTLGSGLNITLAPGYMFSKHIGVELGINYFMGNKVVISNATAPGGSDKTTANSSQIRLLPSLVLNTGGEKLFGFTKVGLVVPVAGDTKGLREVSTLTPLGAIPTEIQTTNKGNMSVGFRGSVGVGYNLSEKLALSLEVFHTSLSIKAKSRVIDSYTTNGVDQIATAPKYSTETNYVDELTQSSNNSTYNTNFSPTSAKDELASKTSYNQLGVSVGIKYNF